MLVYRLSGKLIQGPVEENVDSKTNFKPARKASKCDTTKLSAAFQNKQLTTIFNISCCQDDETAANRKTFQVNFPTLFVLSL